MKTILTYALVLSTCLSIGAARAQTDPTAAEINRLKDEIQRRELVERNALILPSDKQTNRVNLDSARARLRALLQTHITAKQELQTTLGNSISAEESQSIARTLESLEAELRALEQSPPAPPSSTPTTADTRLAATPTLSIASPAGGGQSPSLTPSVVASPLDDPATAAGASAFTPRPSDKTDILPIRSCTEVASALQQSARAASQIEKFFCRRVDLIEKDKVGNLRASFNFRRDFFTFLIFLLAREGRAQYVLAAEEEKLDKQVGADAGSSGSTSLVSKGSVPSILGFAVDSGALLQSSSGSTVTFRGNLAGLAKAIAGQGFISGYDTDGPGARLLRKVSFSLAYDPSRGSQVGVFTGTKQQLANYSIHFDLYNKRDPREPRYRQDWNKFLSGVSEALVGQTQASLERLTNAGQDPPPANPQWLDPVLQDWYVVTDTAIRNAAPGEVEAILKERLNSLPTNLSDATIGELHSFDTRFQPWLEGREAILAKVAKAPVVSFEYLNDRPTDAPTLSKLKFIAETGLQRWLDLTFNGSLTLFNRRPATETKRVRDFQFALQLDAQMGEMGLGLGKPVFSFAGRFERLATDANSAAGTVMPNTRGDIGAGQLKLTIPIKNSGVRIPLSLSFANRTELVKEKEVRGNFGFTFDLDSLFAKFKPFSHN